MEEKLFNILDELEQKYINVWQTFSNIESPTNCKEGVDKACGYLADIAKELGFEVEVFEQPISGNVVVIKMNSEINEKPICFSGHADTVHPIGTFGNPPVKMDGEKIYGPGVCDCKGGVVSSLYAMEVLSKCGYKKRPLMLLIQTDEEVGSSISNKATINYICEKSKDAVAFLNMESVKIPHLCIERKGIVNFLFEIEGKEAHSSKCETEGQNAILEAAHKIIEIEKIKDAEGLTCCVSKVGGGSALNTVPGKCEFNVNVRFSNKEQYEYIIEKMQEIADKNVLPGTKCKVVQKTFRNAMELCERNLNLSNKINDISQKWGMEKLPIEKHTGGSDAADVAAFGIPCVDALGVCGGYIHSPEEYAFLDSLKESAKRITAIAWEL